MTLLFADTSTFMHNLARFATKDAFLLQQALATVHIRCIRVESSSAFMIRGMKFLVLKHVYVFSRCHVSCGYGYIDMYMFNVSGWSKCD
jgi:hypothetical protein